MGSGTFPVNLGTVDGNFLLTVVKELEDFIKDYEDDVYSGASGGRQFDNTAIDGAYLEKLRIASGLVKECVRNE